MATGVRQRSTAAQRRDTVLRTAVAAFAARGYYGTSTMEVAAAAGISQGYLYRLFKDKQTLFAAVVDHCSDRLRESVAAAAATARSTEPQDVLEALTASYDEVIADRELLMILLHAQGCAGEPVIGEAVRRCYARQVEYVRAVSGAAEQQIRRYFADALLSNVMVAIDAAAVDAPWARTLRA
ncbi:TetR family transcriptional regulator [Actinoplanes sp. NBRC 14428]|uniref:TetR family transcriptional regulator n=1 Tax=Pseudosporangium ferrugineum TaxID=439699 RepID=A0A2T0RXD3_9ACTN|nr:TetR/AcrR family transcriptional regulator [Pseudosporangium ferrugineum]PRY25849.1 TetR family transcriptional regulator [Pseudosporangium ferrugineum]BCJ56096.1 TetR family transcriptional regulator [Actinoplanes sp. NBRC 14428]